MSPLSRDTRTALFFNLPAYAILFVFLIFPTAYSFWVSLQAYDLTNPPVKFAGLNNYWDLFEGNMFWTSLWNTLIFTFSSVSITFVLSLCFAVVLNEQVRGIGKLRGLNALPWTIPPIVTGLMWSWIFNIRYGIVNYLLQSIGLVPLLWAASDVLAMFSVVVARSWHEITFGVLLLLSGLQSIPTDVYEAAKIDGAKTFGRFSRITLPLLGNQIASVLIFETMWTLREFDIIYAMTYGGPGMATTVLGWLVYKLAFLYYDFGSGAAVAFVLASVTMLFAIVFYKVFYRRIEY